MTARALEGEPTPSVESSSVEWVPPHTLLEDYAMHPSMRERVEHFVAGPEVWPRIA